MILVDTGPLVALFDRRDQDHAGAVDVLKTLAEPLITTTPVLAEVFHLLDPSSRGSIALGEMIREHGLRVWFLADATLSRALELMDRYRDHPMDLADASLVVAGETLRTTAVFTLDRDDFSTYRVRIGRSLRAFRVIAPA